MINALFSKSEFKKQPEEFRVGAIISDGMWYSLPKWRKLAKVDEDFINDWIEKKLKTGELIQSPTGSKSYRFSHDSIYKWYAENNIPMGAQLVDFIFPPRIWDGLTETEGFIENPRREIGVVTFSCSAKVSKEVIEALRGVGRVREIEPNKFKCFCLDSSYAKSIIEEVLHTYSDTEVVDRMYSRAICYRRELVDFPPEFNHGIVLFYKNFAKNLAKKTMDTINIFLPDPDDQETQIIMWVIDSIETFDESQAVPFSGYLNSILKKRPYDLPKTYLGKELSDFQRQRSRAITSLKNRTGKNEFTITELSTEMEYTKNEFISLEEKHKFWVSAKTATTLTWDENSEEKSGNKITGNVGVQSESSTDINLANKISHALVKAALKSDNYEDALLIISQIDSSDINISQIKEVSPEFIQQLGLELGLLE